jgi:hypothetical protein
MLKFTKNDIGTVVKIVMPNSNCIGYGDYNNKVGIVYDETVDGSTIIKVDGRLIRTTNSVLEIITRLNINQVDSEDFYNIISV